MFTVIKRLSQEEAQKTLDQIQEWFDQNPDKIECRTQYGSIPRNGIRAAVLKLSQDNVRLPETKEKK